MPVVVEDPADVALDHLRHADHRRELAAARPVVPVGPEGPRRRQALALPEASQRLLERPGVCELPRSQSRRSARARQRKSSRREPRRLHRSLVLYRRWGHLTGHVADAAHGANVADEVEYVCLAGGPFEGVAVPESAVDRLTPAPD